MPDMRGPGYHACTLPDPLPLILLSGMGADERVFQRQREAFPDLVVPKWITPDPQESLAE